MNVESGDSIDNIKQKIYEVEAIAPDKQLLKWGSRVLIDETTLADYNVQKDAVLKMYLKDTSITLGTNKWDKFFDGITSELYFKDTQKVTVTADDKGDGVDKIYYYLSTTALSEEEVKALNDSSWTEYTGEFSLEPQDEYIIYAKTVYKDNTASYICSEKCIVTDSIAPVISGIENGKTYCAAQTVTVTEKHIDTVTVNGTPVTLDENGRFTLNPAEGTQTVVATDKAGNVSEQVAVTVNNGHKGGTATYTDRAKCEVCGEPYGETDNNKLPKTGDTGSIAMWVTLAVASGIGLLGTVAYRRKKQKTEI